jgi:hypothetical protein
MGKRITTIELCGSKKIYKGRLLGLIDDREFHALMTKKRFQAKVFSCRTIPLAEIRFNYREGFNGLRLVLAIKESNGEAVPGKLLFITEKLSYIGNEENAHDIGILGEDDEYYIVKEEV